MGAMDFIVEGAMIGGFALVAAPAEYLVTGVKTFIVSHDGVVYEKDLAPDTLEHSKAMDALQPGQDLDPGSRSVAADRPCAADLKAAFPRPTAPERYAHGGGEADLHDRKRTNNPTRHARGCHANSDVIPARGRAGIAGAKGGSHLRWRPALPPAARRRRGDVACRVAGTMDRRRDWWPSIWC